MCFYSSCSSCNFGEVRCPPGSSDVSVLPTHPPPPPHKGASVMAPVTDKGIKALKPLSPFLHRQLGRGNNLIWYFLLEKSLSPLQASPLRPPPLPPPERLDMTLTRFRAHYGLKRDLSRQRPGLFVVKASFPASSFCPTLSLHLHPFTSHHPPPPPFHQHVTPAGPSTAGALTGKRISISLPRERAQGNVINESN